MTFPLASNAFPSLPGDVSPVEIGAAALDLPSDALAAVPEASALAMPTEEEIEQTHAAAAAVLAAVITDSIPPTTERALGSVMRYWSLWHRAVYGTEIELLRTPFLAVPGHKVLVFIAHHTPISVDPVVPGQRKRIRTGMPDHVRVRLTALEAAEGVQLAGKRRVARRAAVQEMLHGSATDIDEDVPALKTVQQRVALLGTLHTLRGLKPPQNEDGRIRPMMVSLGKAVKKRATAVLPRAKQAIESDEFQRMLYACHPQGTRITIEGKRDQALLLATYSSGRRRAEVAGLRQEHLRAVTLKLPSGQPVLGYMWDLYKLKGKQSDELGKPVLSVPLIGAAAEAMDAWLDVLRDAGHKSGPVWRTVFPARQGKAKRDAGVVPPVRIGAPIRGEHVAAIVKRRAIEAFLCERPDLQGDDPDVVAARETLASEYADRLGAHSLRSGFITSQMAEGASPYDLMKLTGHSSITSFRGYDRSGNERNPAIAQIMGFTL